MDKELMLKNLVFASLGFGIGFMSCLFYVSL